MDSRKSWMGIVWLSAGALLAHATCSSAPRRAQAPAPSGAAAAKTAAAPRAAMALTRGSGAASTLTAAASSTSSRPGLGTPTIEVRHSLRNAVSRPLLEMARPPEPVPPGAPLRDIGIEEGPTAQRPPRPLRPDPVLQQAMGGVGMPPTLVNFEGTGNENSVQPADTTFAVGRTTSSNGSTSRSRSSTSRAIRSRAPSTAIPSSRTSAATAPRSTAATSS